MTKDYQSEKGGRGCLARRFSVRLGRSWRVGHEAEEAQAGVSVSPRLLEDGNVTVLYVIE